MRFGSQGPRQLRKRTLSRVNNTDSDAKGTKIDSAENAVVPSVQPTTQITRDLELRQDEISTRDKDGYREYKADAGFHVPSVKAEEEEKVAAVIPKLLRIQSRIHDDDVEADNAKEASAQLGPQNLAPCKSLVINVAGDTPLRCLARMVRGEQSMSMDRIEWHMEAMDSERSKLLEQQKWLEKVVDILSLHVGGESETAWIQGLIDLARKLKAGTTPGFYIISPTMTMNVTRTRAYIDPTTANFRERLDTWNVPFERERQEPKSEISAKDDILLLEHINAAKRSGDPYKKAIFSDNKHMGVEQLRRTYFQGERAVLGMLDFCRHYFLSLKGVEKLFPLLISRFSFAASTRCHHSVEKIFSHDMDRLTISMDKGYFLPEQVEALRDTLIPSGDFAVILMDSKETCTPMANSVSYTNGTIKYKS